MRKFILIAGICLSGWTVRAVSATAAVTPERPRLAVVISVDQCRADYLERFRPYFGAGGFRRLLEQGADFRSTYHRHAMTATAPGHATIASGVAANQHGIIANEWFDPQFGRVMAAVEDPQSPVVGAARKSSLMPGAADPELTGSPWRLQATTIGDQLKLRYGAASRVITLANKDRAAIFMGGRLADAAYWFVDGHLVTSRYYRPELPEWLAKFNAEERMDAAFAWTWERLLEPKIYEAVQGPDDAPGEEDFAGFGTVFPHRAGGGLLGPNAKFYAAVRFTPLWTELLGAAVERAIVAEQLGRHAAPDLLCVGFSQLDYAGHLFGPDSQEIMDSVLRLDRVIASLLTTLDREVGEGKYVVVLTGDHGVAPLPERVAAFNRGATAGRLDRAKLTADVEAALTEAYGAPADGAAWVLRDGFGFRLTRATLAAKKISDADAERVVKAALLRSPQIEAAWTRDELLERVPANGPYLEAWRLSFQAERSPDVMFSPHPYIVDRPKAGTNHGTPYDYDAHVPLVWFGAGIKPGVIAERTGTDAIAPTLADLLGVPRPPQAQAAPLF